MKVCLFWKDWKKNFFNFLFNLRDFVNNFVTIRVISPIFSSSFGFNFAGSERFPNSLAKNYKLKYKSLLGIFLILSINTTPLELIYSPRAQLKDQIGSNLFYLLGWIGRFNKYGNQFLSLLFLSN